MNNRPILLDEAAPPCSDGRRKTIRWRQSTRNICSVYCSNQEYQLWRHDWYSCTEEDVRRSTIWTIEIRMWLQFRCFSLMFTDSQFTKANVVLAREFARRYGDKGVHFNSLDPGELYIYIFIYIYIKCAPNPWIGGIKTGLQQHMPGLMRMLLVRQWYYFFLRNPFFA